jgi:predicted transposase/invertase (TIGR01784 family)
MVGYFADRYINLLTDFGFKRIFGTEANKALPIDFLNSILPSYHRTEDLTFKNPEHLGNTPMDRKAIFDIYCQGETGERFIVEVQKAKQDFFKDRSVYYASFPIQEQAEKGKQWNFELKAVYTVGVLDFIFDDHREEGEFLHTVQLKDQGCQVFYDKLTFVYIELPKFTKSLEELESNFEKWLFLLKHLWELEEPPEALQGEIFDQLLEVAEISNFSSTEQQSYRDSLKHYWDLNNVLDTSKREAKAEGRAEGIAEGEQLALEKVAKRMKEAGVPHGEIAQYTGLSMDEVAGL